MGALLGYEMLPVLGLGIHLKVLDQYLPLIYVHKVMFVRNLSCPVDVYVKCYDT